MEIPQIIKALRRNMVETGSLICVGCGREHNCSTHGCAIMKEAADALEELSCRSTQETLSQPNTIEEANELIRSLISEKEPDPCDWCDGKNCITCCLCAQNDEDECNFSLAVDAADPGNRPLTLEQVESIKSDLVDAMVDSFLQGYQYGKDSEEYFEDGLHANAWDSINEIFNAYTRKPEGSEKP